MTPEERSKTCAVVLGEGQHGEQVICGLPMPCEIHIQERPQCMVCFDHHDPPECPKE